MPGWHWLVVIVLALTGLTLFGVSYRKAEVVRGEVKITPRLRAAGLVGLLMLAWSVFMALVGAVIAIAT